MQQIHSVFPVVTILFIVIFITFMITFFIFIFMIINNIIFIFMIIFIFNTVFSCLPVLLATCLRILNITPLSFFQYSLFLLLAAYHRLSGTSTFERLVRCQTLCGRGRSLIAVPASAYPSTLLRQGLLDNPVR